MVFQLEVTRKNDPPGQHTSCQTVHDDSDAKGKDKIAKGLCSTCKAPIFIVHGGKDKQVGIHQAYHLECKLSERNVTFRTFYQMDEGHVPRPPAIKHALNAVKQWMTDVENNCIQQHYI